MRPRREVTCRRPSMSCTRPARGSGSALCRSACGPRRIGLRGEDDEVRVQGPERCLRALDQDFQREARHDQSHKPDGDAQPWTLDEAGQREAYILLRSARSVRCRRSGTGAPAPAPNESTHEKQPPVPGWYRNDIPPTPPRYTMPSAMGTCARTALELRSRRAP